MMYWPELKSTCGIGAPDDIPTVYLRTLYWALSTMSSLGYGSGPSAHTNAEYLLSVFVQVLGACMYAAIFSNIAQLIAKLDAAGSRYSAQLDKINEFAGFCTDPPHSHLTPPPCFF